MRSITRVFGRTLLGLIFGVPMSWALAEGSHAFFEPLTYAGRWDFKNSQSGQMFGGEMKVVLHEKLASSEPEVEVFKGRLSFDGRQTNSKCGTVSTFGKDTPVDVLWEQKGEVVVLSYILPCVPNDPVKQSRRFTLQGMGIVREYALPWGQGLEKLLKQ